MRTLSLALLLTTLSLVTAAPAPLARPLPVIKPVPEIQTHHVMGYWQMSNGWMQLWPDGTLTEKWCNEDYFGKWTLDGDAGEQEIVIRDQNKEGSHWIWHIRVIWKDAKIPAYGVECKASSYTDKFSRP